MSPGKQVAKPMSHVFLSFNLEKFVTESKHLFNLILGLEKQTVDSSSTSVSSNNARRLGHECGECDKSMACSFEFIGCVKSKIKRAEQK